ncbi:MAG: maleate cis-trans isomerase family protein [Pseudooceanicola sp.]
MRHLPHRAETERAPQLGVIVLQEDETLEQDFRRLIPAGVEFLTSRVPSGAEVTPETLAAMEGNLGTAAALLPRTARFASLAYACTSGAAQIGPARVAGILRETAKADHVTDPVTALVAACRALGVSRLGLLSPYMASVSDRLCRVLAEHGIDTPVFGSFDVAEEARVVRIDAESIRQGALALAAEQQLDALFLSCTNLRTLNVIPLIEAELGLPVLSSNVVLAWHMLDAAGQRAAPGNWGRLLAPPAPAKREDRR